MAGSFTRTPVTSPSAEPTRFRGEWKGFVKQGQAVPNPQTGGRLRFSLYLSGRVEKVRARLYGKSMAMAAQQEFSGAWMEGWNQIDWPVAGLANGIYWVAFATDQDPQGVIVPLVVLN